MDGRKSAWKVDWPLGDGKVQRDKPFTGDELNDTFTSIMSQRAALVGKRGDLTSPPRTRAKSWRNTPPNICPDSVPTSLESLQHSSGGF